MIVFHKPFVNDYGASHFTLINLKSGKTFYRLHSPDDQL